MDQPEIGAGDLVLRPWRQADADDVVRAWADLEILRWGRYGAVTPQRENVEQWLDWNHEQWHFGLRAGFAVCAAAGAGLGDDGELVGSIALRGSGHSPSISGSRGDTAETGYWIVPGWRGRGVATLALDALSRWAFEPAEEGGLGLRRIELRHSVANPASCRVATKAGYAREGTLRGSTRYADGDWHDEHLHARLFSDPAV
jgi:RimJ/RimL family protein N-acetyltransferase